MNSLIFLVVVLCIYYAIYKYKREYIEERYHYYLGGFVAVYLSWWMIQPSPDLL